jgi:TPR repeat protein
VSAPPTPILTPTLTRADSDKWWPAAVALARTLRDDEISSMMGDSRPPADRRREAVSLLRAANDGGDATAPWVLSKMEPLASQARWNLASVAAHRGCASAAIRLAEAHLHGEPPHVAVDHGAALQLFRVAAGKGRRRAAVSLGAMHLSGIGTAPSVQVRAAAWRDAADVAPNLIHRRRRRWRCTSPRRSAAASKRG